MECFPFSDLRIFSLYIYINAGLEYFRSDLVFRQPRLHNNFIFGLLCCPNFKASRNYAKKLETFSKMYNFQIALTISFVSRGGISREILTKICHLDFNWTRCLSASRQRDQVKHIWKGISKVLSRSKLSLVTICLKFSSNQQSKTKVHSNG